MLKKTSLRSAACPLRELFRAAATFTAFGGLSLFFAGLTISITLKGLQSIVRSFRSDYGAFYVFDRSRVQTNWNLWTSQLPGIRPYYAVKCNPDRTLLQTLASLGAGFDCASGRELMEVAEVGYKKGQFKDHVVYANPCKPMRDLQKAKALGAPTTVVDSFEEVDKLASVQWQGDALLRLRVEDTGSLMPFSRKFGLTADKASEIASYAKAKGIQLKGVSFHVGSGCLLPEQYKQAIKTSHDAITKLNLSGHDADLVDLGGGYFSTKETFEQAARKIRSCQFHYPKKELRYIAEPGRFFAESAFDLFVQVIGKKPHDVSGWRYTIDESLYGQFSCIPFDHKKPFWIRIPTSYEGKDLPKRKRGKGTLYGRTCDSLDMIASSSDMEELEVGDWLWFPNMGAYTSVTASEFNGFPKPPLHGIDSQIMLPTVEQIVQDGFAERFPKGIKTVTAVSIQEECPAVA